jgi:hypothetical protein
MKFVSTALRVRPCVEILPFIPEFRVIRGSTPFCVFLNSELNHFPPFPSTSPLRPLRPLREAPRSIPLRYRFVRIHQVGVSQWTGSLSNLQPLDDINAHDSEMEIKLDAVKMKV